MRVDEVRNYVYNGLGNIFNVLEKYDLAEKYLLKSIKEDSSDTASDYLTLSDLEQKRGNLEQAENYLQKANSVSIDNDFVPATDMSFLQVLSYQGNMSKLWQCSKRIIK